ncbi:hypothetical protein LTR86_000285 [Recurvomyces mirabilis]|nr:hypothetical protein LTR86_000285 [Recurvomyces mirabilis]
MSSPASESKNASDTEWPLQKVKNGHNDWVMNGRIKTAKCDTCDERVKHHSWICSRCNKHICSECADESGRSKPIHKYTAKHQLSTKCFCAWPSNQAPGLSRKLRDLGLLPAIGPAASVRESSISSVPLGGSVGKAKRRLSTPDDLSLVKKQKIGFDATQAFEPTRASIKPNRNTARPVRYNEQSDDDERRAPPIKTSRLPQLKRKSLVRAAPLLEDDEAISSSEADEPEEHIENAGPLPCAHLNECSTVIVGGGIVGLCIAFELARKCRATKTRHHITIVEIRSDCCSLSTASGSCAGILGGLHLDRKFEPLVAQAEEAWEDLEEVFKLNGGTASVNFKRDNVLGVYTHKGQGRNKKPTWYHGHEMDIFDAEESHTGKIDTQKFARWLEAQCKKLGVRFVYNHHVVSVSSSANNTIKKVCLMSVTPPETASARGLAAARTEDGEIQYLDCQSLVLAAGPWTTGILQNVLFEDDVALLNNVQTAYAYLIDTEMASKADKDDVGLLLPFIAQDDKYIEPRVGLAAHVLKKQVTIFRTAKQTEDVHLSMQDALNPSLGDAKPFGRIREYAGRRLGPIDGNGQYQFEAKNVRTRYANVSTSAGGLPFVGKLPASGPGTAALAGQMERPDGIWLCFGFGMHGTFLGPGAAHVLVSKMFSQPAAKSDLILTRPKRV